MGIRYAALLALVSLLIGAVSSGGDPTDPGLTGRAVDASGRGMSGVQVWIFESGGGVFNTTTNTTGYYSSDVPSGNYTITAEIPGYSFTSATAQVRTGAASVAQNITGYSTAGYPTNTTAVYPVGVYPANITTGYPTTGYPATGAPTTAFYPYGPLYPGGTGLVQGRIVDQSGAGIPSASISVDGLPTATVTDGQGNYRITLSAGMHTLEPMKSGYGIPPRVVFVFTGQTTNFDMVGMRTVALGRGRLSS